MVSKEELERHIGHELQVVTYGTKTKRFNIALECVDCQEVLEDYDY